MRDDRLEAMTSIASAIKKEVQHLNIFNFTDLDSELLGLLNSKLSKPCVRAFFTHYIYLYILECAKNEKMELKKMPLKLTEIELPFITEVMITVMYLYNQIFDKKNGVINGEKINQNMSSANLMKTKLFEYIDNINFTEIEKIRMSIRRIFLFVDKGQHIEKKFTTYSNFNSGLETKINLIKQCQSFVPHQQHVESLVKELGLKFPDKYAFIQLYFTKMYLSCAVLFREMAALIIELTGYQGEQKDNILDFAHLHGITRQIVNDNIDFSGGGKTIGKSKSDNLNDLQHKIITLPLIYHLQKNIKHESSIKRHLESSSIQVTKEEELQILDEILISGALPKSMKIGRDLTNFLESYLDKKNKYSAILLDLGNIAYNNRFYHSIYKRKNQIHKQYRKEPTLH